jgi:plastocyanin
MAVDQFSRTLAAAVVAASLALALNGCKPDAAVKDPATIGRGTSEPKPTAANDPSLPTPNPAPVQAAGAISGTIFFKGTAPVRMIDTSMDPACSLGKPAKLLTEQFVVKGGKLANVFLYLKSGPPEAMTGVAPPTATVVLDQQHCQYVPHVVGVQARGYVEFRNSDPTMHNVHTIPADGGNPTIDISEGPRGQPQTKQFLKPELMIPVRCNNHPWMNAFVNVSATPFFAVSDADGHFDVRGLPPGEYTLAAVHEKLGEKTIHVTVQPNVVSKAEFSYAQ